MVAFLSFPLGIENLSGFLHRFFMNLFDDLTSFLRSKFPDFWPSKLVRETVGAEVKRITFTQLKSCGGKVGLVFINTSSNREFISFHFIHYTTLHEIQWPVRSSVFHYTIFYINSAKRDVHTIFCSRVILILTQSLSNTLIKQIQNFSWLCNFAASHNIIQQEISDQ